jgi:putative pyruvate formate lyase activating enzyme
MPGVKQAASYRHLSEEAFAERVRRAYDLMTPACRLCPKACGAERLAGARGACGADHRLFVASANLHFGEEPPVSGHRGSGAVFLTHCNLACVYCQNYPISQLSNGVHTTPEALAGKMVALQARGAHNINWVTPSHEIAHLLDALQRARRRGLEIPIVYNSSGYDSVEALQLLEGIVDIYLPDMRYADGRVSHRLSGVRDYPAVNRRAVAEMHRQVGDLCIDHEGLAVRGLLVRHLILPGGCSGTADVLRHLSQAVSNNGWVSLMSQYFPAHRAPETGGIDRRITPEEYGEAEAQLMAYGLTRGWVQELEE